MNQWIRARLSFANIVSLLALFVALGGAAYAGTKTKIDGSQIKNHSINAKKINLTSVKGLLHCPSQAPSRAGDLCVGPPRGPSTWLDAMQTCQTISERLPTPGEALQIAAFAQVPYIWTDDNAAGTPSSRVEVRSPASTAGVVTTKDATQLQPFRCILSPTD